MTTSKIELLVELDENRVPEKLSWNAKEGGVNDAEAKAFLLSVWDHETKNALRIDLWTKDMPVDDMKMFFYQTLVTMADNFQKATGEDEIVEDLRDYCAHFADKMKLDQMR